MSIHNRRFYDPNVDPHLQKFFSRPAVQQHIRSQKINEAIDRAPPLYRQILERFTAESRSHGAAPTITNGQIGPSGGGTTTADVCTCEGRGACFHCYFRTRRLKILQSEARPSGTSRYQPTAMEAVVAGLESLAPRPPSSRPASAGSRRASHGGRSDIVPHRPLSRPSSARSTRSATSNTYNPNIGSPVSDLQTYGFFGKDLRGTKSWGAGPALPPKIQRVLRNPAPPPPRCAQYTSPSRELAAATSEDRDHGKASRAGSRPTSAASIRRSNDVLVSPTSYSSPPRQQHMTPPSSSPRGRRSSRPVKSDYDALVLQTQRWNKMQPSSGSSTRHVAFEDSIDEMLSAFAANGEGQQQSHHGNLIEANPNVPHQTLVAGQYIRRVNSATKIQALVRGWMSRRALKPRSAAATCIQRAVKKRLRNQKLASQIKLFQRVGRSYIGRRKFCFVAQRIIMSRWTGTVHNELEKHVIEAHHDSLFFASSLLLILSAERENRIKIVRGWDSALLYFTEVEMEIRERECRKGIARRAALYYKDYLKPAMALDKTHIHQRGVLSAIQREALLDLVSHEAEERNIIELFVRLEKEERNSRKDIHSDSIVAFGSLTHLHQHNWVRLCERRRMEIQAKPPPSPPAAPTKHMLDFGGEDGNDGFDICEETTTNQAITSPLPLSNPVTASTADIPPVTMGELLQRRSRAHQENPVSTPPPSTLIIQQEEIRRLDDDDDEEDAKTSLTDDDGGHRSPPEINPVSNAGRDGVIYSQYPPIAEEEEDVRPASSSTSTNQVTPDNHTSVLQPSPTHVVVEGVSISTHPPAEPVAGDMFVGEDGNFYYYEEVEETDEDGEEEENEEKSNVGAHAGEDAYENSDNDSLPIL